MSNEALKAFRNACRPHQSLNAKFCDMIEAALALLRVECDCAIFKIRNQSLSADLERVLASHTEAFETARKNLAELASEMGIDLPEYSPDEVLRLVSGKEP